MVTENDEGDLASDQDAKEFSFNEQTVERLLATQTVRPRQCRFPLPCNEESSIAYLEHLPAKTLEGR